MRQRFGEDFAGGAARGLAHVAVFLRFAVGEDFEWFRIDALLLREARDGRRRARFSPVPRRALRNRAGARSRLRREPRGAAAWHRFGLRVRPGCCSFSRPAIAPPRYSSAPPASNRGFLPRRFRGGGSCRLVSRPTPADPPTLRRLRPRACARGRSRPLVRSR